MDAPPSLNHVFNFSEVEFEEEPHEEPEEEFEEDPEEDPEVDPEEELEAEAKNDVPPLATLPNEALEILPIGSTYEVRGPSSVSLFPPLYLYGREIASSKIRKVKKRMDEIGQDLGDEMQFSNLVERRVTELENKEHEKAKEMDKIKNCLGVRELGLGALDTRPDNGDDRPVSFRESKPPKSSGSPTSSQIMPPKMMKRKAVKKMGIVGLRRWIKKVEQVFEICTCAKEDKVMFAASTFEGRALTWWNGNVHTLGLVNANRIPCTKFKSMMTTEYCPSTEIQRMEEEL
nr:hypothetical protein [Tanacetum cinerariifolium]